MKQFELQAHTADIRLIAGGGTIEELFAASLEGLCAVLMMSHAAYRQTSNDSTADIDINSIDQSALLVEFLSEALQLMHTKKMVFNRVTFSELTENSLKATINGYPIDSFRRDVKAVTYHEAEIYRSEGNRFNCTIVIDI